MFNLVLMCKLTTTTLAPLPLPCLQVTIHRILKKKASDISKKHMVNAVRVLHTARDSIVVYLNTCTI